MSKKRIGELNGKPIVIGDSNLINKNEILAETYEGSLVLSERNGSDLKTITADLQSPINKIDLLDIYHLKNTLNGEGEMYGYLTVIIVSLTRDSNKVIGILGVENESMEVDLLYQTKELFNAQDEEMAQPLNNDIMPLDVSPNEIPHYMVNTIVRSQGLSKSEVIAILCPTLSYGNRDELYTVDNCIVQNIEKYNSDGQSYTAQNGIITCTSEFEYKGKSTPLYDIAPVYSDIYGYIALSDNRNVLPFAVLPRETRFTLVNKSTGGAFVFTKDAEDAIYPIQKETSSEGAIRDEDMAPNL